MGATAKPKFFVGIDISKLTMDIAVLDETGQLAAFKISNSVTGITDLLKTLKTMYKCGKGNSLFCAEDIGPYATYLVEVLHLKKMSFCMESPLQIKRSMGIQRDKNDAKDALRIAQYASRNYSALRLWKPTRTCILELRMLSTLRKRLLKIRTMLMNSYKSEAYYMRSEDREHFVANFNQSVVAVNVDLGRLQEKMDLIVQNDEHLNNLMQVVTSVPRIGRVTALQIILQTNEFKTITSAKKFASLCGIAPFEHQSGTSLKVKRGVSHLANKELKVLLHMAAVGFARENKKGNLGNYYRRKVAEGKNKMSVLNAIRNKLLHRVFACAKAMTFYTEQ